MRPEDFSDVRWEVIEVRAPHLHHSLSVIAARDIPYVRNANRFQTLSIYLPRTSETSLLIGSPVNSLGPAAKSRKLRYLVHIHGGAWRDPKLHAGSIEATVAHAFSTCDASTPIAAIASLNYTLSQFPTHPDDPYDAATDSPADPAREAVHPRHVVDVLNGLALLGSLGLDDQSYVLSGHSCGACIALQAALQRPQYYGAEEITRMPCPAAVIGLNGLYDLPALVHGLDVSHEQLSGDYRLMLSNAFGTHEIKWRDASPVNFSVPVIADRVIGGNAPRLVFLDQSADDQLVPMNQTDRLEKRLREVPGLQVVRGNRCKGKHAAPWQQGLMIWESVVDTISALEKDH